jgi:hypothetical protein
LPPDSRPEPGGAVNGAVWPGGVHRPCQVTKSRAVNAKRR